MTSINVSFKCKNYRRILLTRCLDMSARKKWLPVTREYLKWSVQNHRASYQNILRKKRGAVLSSAGHHSRCNTSVCIRICRESLQLAYAAAYSTNDNTMKISRLSSRSSHLKSLVWWRMHNGVRLQCVVYSVSLFWHIFLYIVISRCAAMLHDVHWSPSVCPGRLAAMSKFQASRYRLRQMDSRNFSGWFLYSRAEYENLYQLIQT